jgi:hypothetical protein
MRTINQEKKEKKIFIWQITKCHNCGFNVCITTEKRPGYVILNADISQCSLDDCVSNLDSGKLINFRFSTSLKSLVQNTIQSSSLTPITTVTSIPITTKQTLSTPTRSERKNTTASKSQFDSSLHSKQMQQQQQQKEQQQHQQKFVYSNLYHIIVQDEKGKKTKQTQNNKNNINEIFK